MIRVEVEQGSSERFQARLGIPTASCFSRILTPKTMKPSSQAAKYRYDLLAEYFLGEPGNDFQSAFMERGNELEDEAVNWYSFDRGVDVDRVGFCMTDDRRIGCSPDGLVGDDGGLEIKCLAAHTHIGAALNGDDDEHRCQIQGALYVTGRQWWDRLYFHPKFPPQVIGVLRDDKFIAALHEGLQAFLADLDECRERLIEQGYKRIEPKAVDAYCKHAGEDGRWCMKRTGLIETPDGWRCDAHVPVGAEA